MSSQHRVTAVTVAVLATAAGLTAAAGVTEPRHPGSLWTSLALAALLAWSGVLQVHVKHRGTIVASDLFDVVLAVCAVAFSAPVLVLVALGAKGVAQAVERVEPRKALFNTLTAGATAAAMALVLHQAAALPLVLALALAHVAGWAVNHVALVAVLAAAGLRAEVVTASAVQRWAVQGVVSGALGLLLALAWVETPWAVVLFVVPLAALHSAGRALDRAAAERRRLAGTAAASRVLSSGTADDLPAYLEQLRAAFGAQAVFLRTHETAGPPLVAGGPLPASLTACLDDLAGVLPADRADRVSLELPEHVEVLAAKLPGTARGVLAVVDPRGTRDSVAAELATTAAAAREVSTFLAADEVRLRAAQEHERLEAVLRSVADGIITVRADGRVLSFNAAAGDVTGRSPDDVLHGSVEQLAMTTSDGVPWNPLQHVDRRVVGERVQLRTAQGQLRHVDVSSSPAVVDGEDCAVLVLRDVTALVEQERARRRFVIGLGHELRTPLTPLLGWARTLRRHPGLLDGPERDHLVHALDVETARMARLVDNLLTAVDPAAFTTRRTQVDLSELVQAALKRAGSQLEGRTVTVTTSGSVRVTTNAHAVTQVLDNLLSNVARYTPAGSPVQVDVRTEDGAAVVEVVDAGPGVRDELREDIFGLFVRGADDTANPGVGMGLAVSRSLARSLGGDLVCAPPPQRPGALSGAAFRLVLPWPVAPRQPQPAVVTQLFSG